MKKTVSLVLAIVMLLGMFTMNIPVYADETATIKVDSVSASPDSLVEVSIKIINNPGIASMGFTMNFDEGLTLVAAKNGEAFSELTLTPPAQLKKTGSVTESCRFAWLGSDDVTEDGEILRLTFKVSEDVELNKICSISIVCDNGDVLDSLRNEVNIVVENGNVQIITYNPGDVDNNGTINMLDVLTLCQFYVDGCKYDPNGYAVDINPESGDVDASGSVNMLDVLMLCQYYVDGCTYDPNGYGVKLLPGKKSCEHSLEHIAAKEANCVEDGNIEYWHCTKCGDYFADAEGKDIITLAYTKIPATGHTIVIDPAVSPTYEHNGLTEGSHCSVCDAIIVAQEEIPPLQSEQYAITYNITNGDSYLAAQTIENPNQEYYFSASGYTLKNISVPGYTFLGWYDLPSGSNAEIVKKIPAGSNESIELYAHWEKIEYTIQFESDLIPVNSIKYTADQGATLPIPHLDGYVFAGWSDGDGIIRKTIPVGTTGNKVYSANWLSERNKAWAKKSLDAPIVIEDEETNTILFTYEIGRIENVPLYTIEDFGYINSEGITRTVTKEFTVKTEKTLMEQFANNVANSTTNSSQWSLSSGWSDAVNIDESFLQENNITEEEAESLCKTESGNWQISSGTSGSSTTTKYDSSQDYDLLTATSNQKQYGSMSASESASQTVGAGLKIGAKQYSELSAKEYAEVSAKASAGVEGGGAKAGVEVGGKAGVEINEKIGSELTEEFSMSQENSMTIATSAETGAETGTEINYQIGSIKHTGTDTVSTGGWNRANSYGGSNDTSKSNTISKAISEKIASEYGYGKSYINTGDQTDTQGLSTSSSNSNTYTAAVTYGTEETTKETITYTTSNTKTGYHRLIKAGTAHVFATVGYDIKTASYFVSTYTVMDDECHNFEDYSYTTALYDDNQTSVIPFEVPFEVEEYVLNKVGETEGLEFNSAGIVTGYTGEEKAVVIPEYHVVDNRDGTRTVLKITGISSTAFSGNTNITGLELSKFITAIPDNAFEGCSSLSLVNMPGVTSIGKEAFKNCTGIDYLYVSNKVRNIGENAFENLNMFAIQTNSVDAVEYAVRSGAKNIIICLADSSMNFAGAALEVSSNTDTFTLNGSGYGFDNLILQSDAGETIINNITMNSNSATPLKISSPVVQLGQVHINSSGISLMLTNDNCQLGLYGESAISSSSDVSMLCRNVELAKTEDAIKNGVYSELEVNGNIYVCGDITNTTFLNCNGNIITIDSSEFDKYLRGVFKVSFNAAGGSASFSEMNVLYGTKYGTLPTATRSGYTFDGWYTASGEKITSETLVSINTDTTLNAHWIVKAYTASWNTGSGYTITVKRTSSPNKGASTGIISSGEVVYYGDVLSITYAAKTGYTISSNGSTSITVNGNVTSSNIYCSATVNSYKATWSGGTGYTITVSRTSSPNKGAATGTISSGATIYYGDVLSITYNKADYYSIKTKGKTSITVTGNVTSSDIYATAELNALSSWVSASSVPSGAKVIEQKWQYTKTETKESTSSSESGWTQTGNYWKQTGSGSQKYATFPSTFDTNNWYFQNFAKSALTAYDNGSTKREVSNTWGGYIYWHWMYSCDATGTPNRAIYHKSGTGPDNNYVYKYFFAFDSTKGDYSNDVYYCNSQGIRNYIVNDQHTSNAECGGSTRWFRFDYYVSSYTDYQRIYQYKKVTTGLESSTEISNGGQISNVQKYVRYRQK